MKIHIAAVPSPSPIVVELTGQNQAPFWLAPGLTSIVVVIAALIAYLSLRASDKRKLQREDQRQWDHRLTDAYVEILTALEPVQQALSQASGDGDEAAGRIMGHAWDAIGVVRRQILRLELTAPGSVLSAARGVLQGLVETLTETARLSQDELRSLLRWAPLQYFELQKLTEVLRDEARAALMRK
ncbi:hypothetical protein [Curtobacterium flaccumfaciens]|uniref:hypothetical protein n=1 Tax=Curtobacterium flaccumfaciens TaxID=2035 RepID=UPI001BDDEA1F|nr:hypothetical protein [Curtobacterium flaccumfaciens]MBT1631517.1 hypothetical protein [Curtobacterium flaccumfaciens pv. oortii]MCX2846825.1 hypothetical protein [Curtobacterium flaccumfaciens pv. oortii]